MNAKLMTDDGWQINSDKTEEEEEEEEEEESEIVEGSGAATLAQNVSSVNFVTSLLAPKLPVSW